MTDEAFPRRDAPELPRITYHMPAETAAAISEHVRKVTQAARAGLASTIAGWSEAQRKRLTASLGPMIAQQVKVRQAFPVPMPSLQTEPLPALRSPRSATSDDIRELGQLIGDQGYATVAVLRELVAASDAQAATSRLQARWLIVLTGVLVLLAIAAILEPVLLR